MWHGEQPQRHILNQRRWQISEPHQFCLAALNGQPTAQNWDEGEKIMRMDTLGFDSFLSTFLRPRSIHRIDDGRRVNQATAKDLRGLSESTLRDMGYTSCAG